MPNKRYNEDENAGGSDLPQKVKGEKGKAPSFAEVPAEKDDAKADLNKTGVVMPQESGKRLPQAGKTS